MKTVGYNLLVVALVALASVVIGAQKKEKASISGMTAADRHTIIDPANLAWGDPPPGFPAGAKFAVLSGDPGKPGIYTVRMQAPAGYKIQAHTHPTAELITVLSGTPVFTALIARAG